MDCEFTPVIEKKGRWYIGYVEEIPGVNTQGRALAELRRNLQEAVQLILEANRSLLARKYSSHAKRELISALRLLEIKRDANPHKKHVNISL